MNFAGTTAIDITDEPAMNDPDPDLQWSDVGPDGAPPSQLSAANAATLTVPSTLPLSPGSSAASSGGTTVVSPHPPSHPPMLKATGSAPSARHGSFQRLLTDGAGVKAPPTPAVPFPFIFPATEWTGVVVRAAQQYAGQQHTSPRNDNGEGTGVCRHSGGTPHRAHDTAFRGHSVTAGVVDCACVCRCAEVATPGLGLSVWPAGDAPSSQAFADELMSGVHALLLAGNKRGILRRCVPWFREYAETRFCGVTGNRVCVAMLRCCVGAVSMSVSVTVLCLVLEWQ